MKNTALYIKPVKNESKPRSPSRGTASQHIAYTGASAVLLLWCAALLVPLAFGLNASLKENGRAFMENPVSLPAPPYFSNYPTAFANIRVNERSFFSMILNSLLFSVPGIVASAFFTSAVSYACAKYKFKAGKFVYVFILVYQLIPFYGGLPATYRLMSNLGFLNSPLFLIASLGVNLGHFLYFYAFFKGLQWEYAESAFVDGAGHWRTFLQIMLPMVFSSMFVLMLLSFIGAWNDFTACMIYYGDKFPTLAYGIYVFEQRSVYMANQPVYFSGAMLSCVPVAVLFFVFQDSLMDKLYLGGLKG
jgi:ABC-type glycerol-3-phosphate transport system permease component